MNESWIELRELSMRLQARVFRLGPECDRVLIWIPSRKYVAMAKMAQAIAILNEFRNDISEL